MSSIRASFWELCKDEFLVLSVPQKITINNKRLGVMLRFLQVMLFVFVIIYLITERIWLTTILPVPQESIFRIERPADDGDLDRGGPHPQYCLNTSNYWVPAQQQIHDQKPQRCREMSSEDAIFLPGEVLIPTSVRETSTVELPGQLCMSSAAWCNGTWSTSTTSQGTLVCNCQQRGDYLVANSEQFRIFLIHGYDLAKKGSNKWGWLVGGHVDVSFLAVEVTLIQRQDGTPCVIGGHSAWLHSNGQNIISGSLREWLACAGINLDDRPSNSGDGVTARHYRSMGVTLELQLDYRNLHSHLDYEGVVCTLTIKPLVRWTEIKSKHHAHQFTQTGLITEHTFVGTFGVRMFTKTTGAIMVSDITSNVQAIVQLAVLSTFPRSVTAFVALYCLGLVSELYRRARRTRFSIQSHLRYSIAKMMLAEVGFRGLQGGDWKAKASGMYGLGRRRLLDHMNDLFHQPVDAGVLQSGDLENMTKIIFQGFISEAEGRISCVDFVRALTVNDVFDMHCMVRFLAGKGLGKGVQRIFDQEYRKRQDSLERTQHFRITAIDAARKSLFPSNVSDPSFGSTRSLSSVLEDTSAGAEEDAEDVMARTSTFANVSELQEMQERIGKVEKELIIWRQRYELEIDRRLAALEAKCQFQSMSCISEQRLSDTRSNIGVTAATAGAASGDAAGGSSSAASSSNDAAPLSGWNLQVADKKEFLEHTLQVLLGKAKQFDVAMELLRNDLNSLKQQMRTSLETKPVLSNKLLMLSKAPTPRVSSRGSNGEKELLNPAKRSSSVLVNLSSSSAEPACPTPGCSSTLLKASSTTSPPPLEIGRTQELDFSPEAGVLSEKHPKHRWLGDSIQRIGGSGQLGKKQSSAVADKSPRLSGSI